MSNRRNATKIASILLRLCLGAGLWGALPAVARAAEPETDLGYSERGEFEILEPGTPGKDGSGLPPASTPGKADRADVLTGEAPFADPAFRAEMLQELYDQLRNAKDAAAAEPIAQSIEELWHSSGSDTVDLLMSRVDAFVLDADLDLALQVLDAVTDIAPDNAEAWHQRGIVHLMQYDNEAALSDFRRALDIDPDHYKALRDLGAVLQQTGDKKGALEAYRQALDVNPFLEQARRAEKSLSLDVDGRDI
ncbi:MAG: tetratricopeptide repeat protein [Methyloceanibacter sp.]